MQVSKATSSIRRLFASLDIHYNNSQNTEVQKQNETQIKKLQTKVFWLNVNSNFQEKQATGKLSGINFNHTNRLHLVLIIRIYFDKNLNYAKVQPVRILANYNSFYIISN